MGKISEIKNWFIRGLMTQSRRFNIPRRNYSDRPSRFLVVSTTGIGDTLWGTPAIRALKEAYPKGFVGVLTTEIGVELLRGNPYIDRFFIFRRGFRFFSLLKLLKELRQERFDIAFIFHASDRIIWPLVFFAGAFQIIGMAGQNKGLDFVLTKVVDQEDIHGVEMRLKLLREVGVFCSPVHPPEIYISEEERGKATKILRDISLDEGSFLIGLHPGAQKPYKRWSAERFIETGRRLVELVGCRLIVTGNRKEQKLCDHVASRIKGAISIAGRTTLRETAAIVEKMQLFVTNDTGPMHMAFALGTPTVALFCPTDSRLCGPYNAEDVVIVKKPLTCDPCIGKKCLTPVCMEQITVEEVLERARFLLKIDGRYADNAV
ncbi:MAG: glycosyltransferase family 9 protein [Thermodesulfovibrionales bacterium]